MKTQPRSLTVVISMFAMALTASAATYYVSPTGDDDNAGSSAAPFKTIQKALDSLTTDNCWKSKIWINAGIYQIESELKVTSGTYTYTIQSVSGNPSDVAIDAQNLSRCFNCTGASGISFKGITFINGSASGNGGGVLAATGCAFDDCVISNCTATGDGGGIYANASLNHISGIVVNGCSATKDGGGMYLSAGISEPEGMSNSRIYNCSSGNRGGGLRILGSAACVVNDCDISANTASGRNGGGGIYADNATICYCTITNNVCDHDTTSSESTGGSGIRFAASGAIDGCLVQGNSFTYDCSSYNGGGSAVWLVNGSSLVNSAIVSNSGARSVGFQWTGSGGVLVSNCLFKANRARLPGSLGRGGLFYLYNLKSDSMITDCRFIDNEACQSGSLMEIQMADSSSSTLRIRNCLMIGNVQTAGDGMILSWNNTGNTQLAMENCTIVSNRVNTGPVVSFWNEAAAQSHSTVSGCAILFNNGKNAFDNTYKASANATYNCTEQSGMSAGNLAYDSTKPLFADLENGDFRPTADSQLRDVVPSAAWMGDGSLDSKRDLGGGYELQSTGTYGVNVVWTDSVPRLYRNRADIGCFEFWRPPTPPGLAIIIK